MINEAHAKKVLNKIITNDNFSSKIDNDLLTYLINATLRNETPKETTIAVEVFGKNKDFNPAYDSIVRNHMYVLRNKLQTYYLTDGRDDDFQLVIPKGKYKIDFINKTTQKTNKTIREKFYLPLIIIVILFTILSIYLWQTIVSLEEQSNAKKIINTDNPIWSDFLQSNLRTCIVLGDYYVFQEPLHLFGRERFIRDVEINSKQDLDKYLNENPEEKKYFIETPLTYLGMEVPNVIFSFCKVFNAHYSKLIIKLGSDLIWQDIQQNNIIFCGSNKTLRDMNHFLTGLRFKATIFPHKVYYTPNYSDTTEVYSLESYYRYGFHDDYCIVAKFPSSEKTTLMMFISFSSFGRDETVKKLTDPKFEEDLKSKNLVKDRIPPYFEILFKVYGVERSGFKTDIIHFHEIDPVVMLNSSKS